ncbi:MAG: PadR family transcriptional regulator [Solirubrobacteraceae bacterium]
MSARHAVLGLVIEQPGYGYQLGRRLEERCGAWGWERSGVYGALNSLSSEGNVRSVRQKGSQTGRAAPRAIYEATPRGEDFFSGWMLESSAPTPVRQELDLKLLFSGPEFLPHLIDETWAQERWCLDELRELTSTEQPGIAGRPGTWREAAVILQRDAAVMAFEARIEWLQKARKLMTEFHNRSAGNHRSR